MAILGNPGSTPLELFWDEVDKLDQIFDPKLERVEEFFRDKDFNVEVGTTKEQFMGVIGGAELDGISDEDLDDIFDFVSWSVLLQEQFVILI